MTTIAEQSMHQADLGTLRNYVSSSRGEPIRDAMLRLLEGDETDTDRDALVDFATRRCDAYPRTCEALARVLDGGAA